MIETSLRIVEPDREPGEYPNAYAAVPPNDQRCAITGLGHAHLYQLLKGALRGKVRVVSLREPNAKRGKLLFHVGDMLRYLDGLATAQRVNQPQSSAAEAGRAA
jgi:hypothetical protein